jgi:hypothetical protein
MPSIGKSAVIGVGSVYRSGAPRPMKMGTTASPWRYDDAARHALQWANLRRPVILHYASSAAVSPISPVVRLSFDSSHTDQSQDGRDAPLET